MKLDLLGRCPVCLRRRGGNVNHAACSRILQRQKLAEMAKPHVWPDGSESKTKDGAIYTAQHHAQTQLRQASKQYGRKRSDAFWEKFN